MIDRPGEDETRDAAEAAFRAQPDAETDEPRMPGPKQDVADLYSDLFPQSQQSKPAPRSGARITATTPARSRTSSAVIPAPQTLEETGLSLVQLSGLVLKQLYLQGSALGLEISRSAHLPFSIIDTALVFLKEEKCIEVTSGNVIGRSSYRFHLTELGRVRARESFEQCRYVGPAPVPLDAYVRQCQLQTVVGIDCTPERLEDSFSDFIIREGLLEELGPAVCSGRSIFIYGPPGNGKTLIAKGLGRFLNRQGGEIHVPYALQMENSIITLFDPTIHETTDDHEFQESTGKHRHDGTCLPDMEDWSKPETDLRWRRIRRPVVITGGELNLEMLDLRYNKTSNFYTAPLHIKANGGVFLIDDFGRQLVSPKDLLNRWIMPLEDRTDYLTLATGKKFAVPFEQLIVFSTNLDPKDLVDEAFLRRIRHKIQIGPPSRELFTEITQLCCRQRDLRYDPVFVDYLYDTYYNQGQSPRSSDPRDLLEILQSICRFKGQEPILSTQIIAEAAQRFFCQI
ncbi:ATPase [Gimesia panareensis]|nr:ATPase [Gimesia panareensis]